MNPNRRWIITIIVSLLLLTFPIPAASEPCCIIVVPPPPSSSSSPGSPKKSGLSSSDISIYTQLPLFAAIERKAFKASLKVEIKRKSLREALNMVHFTQGVLGLTTINNVAWYKVETEANIEIAAVTINRPYYRLYTLADGPATFKDLKGKVINISGMGILEHAYAIKALRSAGLSMKDATYVSGMAAGPTGFAFTADALKSGSVDAMTGFIGYQAAVPKFRLKQIETHEPITLPSWVIYANLATLENEVKEVNEFIKGFTKGINIVKEDQQLTRNILEKEFNISNQGVQDLIVKYIPFILPDSVKPDAKEMEVTLEIISWIAKSKKAPVLLDEKRLQELYQ